MVGMWALDWLLYIWEVSSASQSFTLTRNCLALRRLVPPGSASPQCWSVRNMENKKVIDNREHHLIKSQREIVSFTNTLVFTVLHKKIQPDLYQLSKKNHTEMKSFRMSHSLCNSQMIPVTVTIPGMFSVCPLHLLYIYDSDLVLVL